MRRFVHIAWVGAWIAETGCTAGSTGTTSQDPKTGETGLIAESGSTGETGTPPVDDGIDISGTWTGGCDQVSSTDTAWPLHTDWTFDLVDTYGVLTGTAGQAFVHGSRDGLNVNFHLSFSASTTGSTNEEYFALDLDPALTTMTGELASYVTGPTYACTFSR